MAPRLSQVGPRAPRGSAAPPLPAPGAVRNCSEYRRGRVGRGIQPPELDPPPRRCPSALVLLAAPAAGSADGGRKWRVFSLRGASVADPARGPPGTAGPRAAVVAPRTHRHPRPPPAPPLAGHARAVRFV